MSKKTNGYLIVLLVALFGVHATAATIVDLGYNNNGSGGLDLTNAGTTGGAAVNSGAVLGDIAGQGGSGCALLNENSDSLSVATGKGDMAEGAVQFSVNLYTSNPTCRLVEGLGSADAARLWITAAKDSSGWYLDARMVSWDGGWVTRQVTNWGGMRIDVTGGWHTITLTWGSRGKELYIDDDMVAANEADTSGVAQFYKYITGSQLTSTTARGYYDDVKLYDTQIAVPEPATMSLLVLGCSSLLLRRRK